MLPPDRGAELGIRIVGGTVGRTSHQIVVVVLDYGAVGQNDLPVPVVAVLQVQRDGPARPVGDVGATAVVDPAVVEVHVSLGDRDRNLLDGGVVGGRVVLQHLLELVAVAVGEVAGGAVV